MDWNEEQVKSLIQKFEDGLSFSVIAERISAEFNEEISRNAAIGKLHRLGYRRTNLDDIKVKKEHKKREPKTNGHCNYFLKKKEFKPKEELPNSVDCVEPSITTQCSLLELRSNQCHWPIGAKPPFMYCGYVTVNGTSYCKYHNQISIRPRQQWRY
jgi:hypothetical protein